MNRTAQSLSNDPKQLQEMVLNMQGQLFLQQQNITRRDQQLVDLNKVLKSKEETIERLLEQLTLLRSKRFQSQSEQLKHIQGQLFDEAELDQAIRDVEEQLAEVQSTSTQSPQSKAPVPKDKPRRKPLPVHLRRIEIVVDVSPEDKQMMGDDWELIGYEESEQCEVV